MPAMRVASGSRYPGFARDGVLCLMAGGAGLRGSLGLGGSMHPVRGPSQVKGIRSMSPVLSGGAVSRLQRRPSGGASVGS